ncbi:MAG: hypothetical protein L6R35_000526 [Caloplaca aegaea]|nr:MAG: hypothetical protein L6R35_000526 [Caloplaca aegaea]
MLALASHNILSGSSATPWSEGISRALQYTSLGEGTDAIPEEEDETSLQLLKRTLSTRSVISTTSSFASRMQHTASKSSPNPIDFRNIGLGSCGSVFEVPGTQMALKKGSSLDSLWIDFCLTNTVHNAILDVATVLQMAFPNCALPRTPLCYGFQLADDCDFWTNEMLRRFPSSHREKQPIFQVDRIRPVPKAARDALIEYYFDEDIVATAKQDPDNKDCLIRLYLGERESVQQRDSAYDTLRNFPMRLNMMEDLDLEVLEYATQMAIGLATLHWQARVDGMDVEFVLGSSAARGLGKQRGFTDVSTKPHKVEPINFKRRRLHLWMFDFDKATKIEWTEEDVKKKLVPAFLGNDPYYPLPQVDEELWGDFCATYLKASRVILLEGKATKKVMGLPRLFLDEVLRVTKENEDWDEEENIVFSE